MALLGYKKRFIDPLLSGQKTGTIRAFRKIPIVPGERLYHYTGLRTKYCEKIGESTCLTVGTITIYINSGKIDIQYPNNICSITSSEALDDFAMADGFSDWQDMKQFWLDNHGIKLNGRKVLLTPFNGIHILHTPLINI